MRETARRDASLASYRTIVNVETAAFGAEPPHRMKRAADAERPVCPTATYCNISYDADAGEGCYLVRFAPGPARRPTSTSATRSSWCSTGSLTDCDGTVYRRSDFVSLKPGSKHVSVSEDGATLLVFIRGGFRVLGETRTFTARALSFRHDRSALLRVPIFVRCCPSFPHLTPALCAPFSCSLNRRTLAPRAWLGGGEGVTGGAVAFPLRLRGRGQGEVGVKPW